VRSTHLIAAALAVLIPWHARGGEPCNWQDPGKPPRLFLRDGMAFFRTYYTSSWAACAAGPNDKIRVQWFVGKDSSGTPLRTEELSLDRTRKKSIHRIEARLSAGVCDGRNPQPGAQRKLTGLPGKEHLSEILPVHVSISATGPLAPLARQSESLDFPCPACGSEPRGRLSARVDPDQRLSVEGELDAKWFDCAKQGATLLLRAFAGHDESDVVSAIRPNLVVANLEKAFVRKGDKYVLHETLPKARLCARGGPVWSFEFGGRGELQRASGGGREIYWVRCK
jgi:hypothetical protein